MVHGDDVKGKHSNGGAFHPVDSHRHRKQSLSPPRRSTSSSSSSSSKSLRQRENGDDDHNELKLREVIESMDSFRVDPKSLSRGAALFDRTGLFQSEHSFVPQRKPITLEQIYKAADEDRLKADLEEKKRAALDSKQQEYKKAHEEKKEEDWRNRLGTPGPQAPPGPHVDQIQPEVRIPDDPIMDAMTSELVKNAQRVFAGLEEMDRKRRRGRTAIKSNRELAVNPDPEYAFGNDYAVDGDAKFKRVQDTIGLICNNVLINGRPLTREAVQQQFIDAFIFACAPLIYGTSWETNRIKFYERHGITTIDQFVFVMAARRFGKTVGIALFCLAMILNVPAIKINVFSTNKRTSTAICEMIRGWLMQIPMGKDRNAGDAKELVQVIPETAMETCRTKRQKIDCPHKSAVQALPNTVNGMLFVVMVVVIG